MKRVILRLVALATVVVLGVVVIVRAQRGAEPDPSASEPVAGSPDLTAAAGDARAGGSPEAASAPVANPLRSQPASTAPQAASADAPAHAIPNGEWPVGTDPFSAAHTPPSGSGDEPTVIPAADYRRSPQEFPSYGATAAVATSPATRSDAAPELMPVTGPAAEPMMPAAGGPGAFGAGTLGPEEGYAAAGAPLLAQDTQSPATLPGNPAALNAEPRHLPTDLGAVPAASSGTESGPAHAPAGGSTPDSASAGPSGPEGPPFEVAGPETGWPQTGGPGAPPGALEGGGLSVPPGPESLGGATGGSAPVAGEGTGRPGSAQLEGPQTPQVTVQKIAPDAVQVGQLATFRLLVRNTGNVVAADVEVRDEVPKGSRLVQSNPQAARGAGGELVWKLGSLQPGQEVAIETQVVPLEEGELGSVARVSFQAEATARCVVTKPELVLQASAPEQVLIGEQINLTILVSNAGSGPARGVVLEEHVPGELQHPAGAALEYVVGDLQPGESRQLELTLTAQRPGPATNLLVARGEGNLHTENRLALEVVAPRLEVAVEGPQRRFLEREATYQFAVANPGTAAAEQVELVAYLPPGLEFVRANNAGYYEQSDHTVRWRLEQLPVDELGTVELVAMPVQAGQHEIKLRAAAARGAESETAHPVLIEGIAALLFQAADEVDPIQVGEETSYEIRVVNQGTKAATGLMLAVVAPPEMQPVAAEGPTAHTVDAQNRVLFQPLARLAPKADTTYRVRVRGLQPGDLRVRVQLMADEMHTPVTKEESTRVYSDQ